MGPGPRGPGNLVGGVRNSGDRHRFNGAGTARSRKCRNDIRYTVKGLSFNGAGTARSRK